MLRKFLGRTPVRLALAVVFGSAAFAAPAAGNAAITASCTWSVPLPARYAIGPTYPDADSTGTCESTPWGRPGPANWFLTTHVGNTSMPFQGCNDSKAVPPGGCVRVGGGAEYQWVPVYPLRITGPGTFTATVDPHDRVLGCTTNTCETTFDYTVVFTATTTTAKYATTTGLKIVRSGTKRTFTITPRHWSPRADAYVRSTNLAVYLQRYANSRWTTYKTFKTSAWPIVWSGRFAGARTWRAVTSTNATMWRSTSSTVKS